jgi:uncharacterized protein YggE
MRRDALGALALALLLATAGCSAFSTPDASARQNVDDGQNVDDPAAEMDDDRGTDRTVRVSASGSAETAPDQAVLRVSVVATGDDASVVRDRLSENVSQVREALADVGVDSVRTLNYDIDRNYRAREEPDAPEYRGRHTLEVTLKNVSKVGEVIDAAVESGATNVEDVRFTLSEEKRRNLRQDALADAMENARSQADTLATEANLEITGVHDVSTTERGPRPHRYEATAGAADGGTSVDAGPVAVNVNVRVTYNATDA